MADKDFRIDLILGAKFAEGFRAIDEAKRRLEGAERSAGKFSRTGATLGAVLRTAGYAGIAAASAATAVMGLYIQKTIEAEKVQAQLAARIKDTGGVAGRTLEDLNKQSKALSHVTVFDDEAIGQAQAMLLTFTQIRGVNFDNTVEATLNLATAMGTDATDAAKTLGKALSDPAKGMDQLKRAGVTFTDAQRAVIQKMVETGHISEAQGMLLDALKYKMGSAATAARDTLGGALQALKNAFDDVLEGDTGDAGIKGTRNAIESLIGVLNDPSTRAGVQAFIGDLASIAGFAARAIAAVGGLSEAVRQSFNDVSKKSYDGLLAARANLEDQLGRSGGNGLADGPDPIGKLLGISGSGDANQLRQQIADIDKRRAALRRLQADAASRQRGKDFQNVIGGVDLGPLANPAPEGEGIIKPSKTGGGGSKSDPDAAAKNYLADLQKQVALLGLVKQGEDDASEAAKAHYAVTEGEYKNASPALKAQIEAAAQALDQKKADTEAEEKRQEAIKQSKEAYDDLLKELRTPAEVAVDDAIAKINTLTEALQRGQLAKPEFDADVQKIVGDQFNKPLDGSGGFDQYNPFAELEERRKAIEADYKARLDALAEYRQEYAGLNAVWDQIDLQTQAQHTAALQQLQQDQISLMLGTASAAFGSLAQLAQQFGGEQSKTYRVLFALSKGFAVAQAAVSLATNIAKASEIGFPQNLPFIAGAIAQGAQIASILAGANYSGGGGYAEGGYTGAGGKYQPAGIVHAGEGVLNQGEIAALGGPSGFYALREWIDEGHARAMLQGYADGGLAGASMPALTAPDWGSYPQGNIAFKGGENRLSLYNLFDVDSLAQKIANHPALEERMVVVAGENGNAIRGRWGGS